VSDPGATVLQLDGRRKVYRPLAADARARSVALGLEHYERGEAFEAHEAWEPAWMGTDDVAERALLQGLIKLAAADVHAARGNPAGVATNLRGAAERLRAAAGAGRDTAPGIVVDLGALVDAVTRRLELAERGETTGTTPIPWRPA
jgi:predicted metal-dependent hydrolase